MKLSKVLQLSVLLICAVLFQSASPMQKEPIGSFTYKLGSETKTVQLKSLSVRFKTETVGESGKEKSNSSVGITVYDYENNKGFVFTIKDDKVVTELKGQYPLRFPAGFEDGESLRSTGIMVVDTKTGSNVYQSTKGGTCDVLISGTTAKITIKSGSVKAGDKIIPFEFTLSTDQAKIKFPS